MSLLKPANIQGLNTGHSLYADLAAFWEIGQTDKDLVSDTALGTTRTVTNDADIGACRTYKDTAPGDFSQTLPVTKGASYTFIFKSLQEYGPMSTLMDGIDSYNQMELRIDRYSSGSVRLDQRYGSGGTVINEWHPFSTDDLMDDPQIMTLTVDASGNTVLYVNGSVVAHKAGTDLPNTDTPDASPIPHNILTALESANNFYLGAVVKHGKVLTSGEITAFHGDPWAAVSTTAPGDTTPPVYEVAPAVTETRENGHTISGTADEDSVFYGVRLPAGATVPTSQQVIDGQDASGSPALEADFVAASAGISADLDFVTASASTSYRYAIVAVDDEPTPNVQATPTVIDDTTAAAVVEGISAQTIRDKAGDLTPNATNLKIAVRESSDPESTVHFSTTNGSLNGSSQTSAINLESAGVTVGDTVHFSYFNPALNEGLNVDLTVEDIA